MIHDVPAAPATKEIMLEDVLDHAFVDIRGLCKILGLAKQTVHNKLSDGTLGIDPYAKLEFGINRNIYLRTEAIELAERRRKR